MNVSMTRWREVVYWPAAALARPSPPWCL